MVLKVTIVVGNPKPKSRTLQVAQTFADRLLEHASGNVQVIDLVDHVDEILQWPSKEMDELTTRVAESDLVIFASPTYKATYTGLLKVFLDRYPANGLAGVTAIPVLTGADLSHAMGPTVNLIPLLLELGAMVPGRGLYFVISQMHRMQEIIHDAADEYLSLFRQLNRVGLALGGASSVTAPTR